MRARRALPASLALATAALFSPGAIAQATAPGPASQPPGTSAMQDVQLVDRIAAIVDGEVITLAQLNRALQLRETNLAEGTNNCTPPAGPEADAAAPMLQCMIDWLLMFQHVRRFPQFDAPADDIEARYQRRVEQSGSRQAFEEELRRMQLTPSEVRYDLERQALVANYVNLRYRTVIDIAESAVRRYYDEVLRSEMERRGAELPRFEDVDEFIRPILVEAEVNRRVDEWIVDLRRRADIIVYLW